LKKILGDYPGLSLNSVPLFCEKPYSAIYHYRKEIRQYALDPARTDDEKPHLAVLTDFMSKHLITTEIECDRLQPHGMVTYKDLWTLFRPKQVVMAQRDYEADECYMIDACEYMFGDMGSEKHFSLKVRCWDYNGVRFGPSEVELVIEPFSAARRINTLPAYPLDMYDQDPSKVEELRTKLIQRGLKWKTLLRNSHREYHGIVPQFFL
jgi:hypothetical protein